MNRMAQHALKVVAKGGDCEVIYSKILVRGTCVLARPLAEAAGASIGFSMEP